MNKHDYYIDGIKPEILRKISNKYITPSTALGIDNLNYERFLQEKNNIIENLHLKLAETNFKFTRYKEKLILKNRYSLPRIISIPTFEDRIVLKAMQSILKEYFPEVARTDLPQEIIKKIERNLKNSNYDSFIKIDISNFFGSINYNILISKLSKRIRNNSFLELIESAIKNPTFPEEKLMTSGLPQGISISNILAEIYMIDVTKEFNKKDYFFIRYVDDILILCNSSQMFEIKNKVVNYLEHTLLLTTNESKNNYGNLYTEKFDYLGYAIWLKNKNTPALDVKKENRIKLEKRLISLITKYKYKFQEETNNTTYTKNALIFELNLIISGSITKNIEGPTNANKRYGWIFYFSKITEKITLYHLDSIVRKKAKKILDKKELNKVKKFSTAYHKMKYELQTTNYFFKPDNFSYQDKIEFLNKIYNITINNPTRKKVDKIFRNFIFKQIKDNDRDLLTEFS